MLSSEPAAVARALLTHFSHPALLGLALVLPALALLTALAARRRQKLLLQLGSILALRFGVALRPGARALRALCLFLGLLLLAVGAAGPQWGLEGNYEIAGGRDIVVVLDASRSMLAEVPPRHERARQMLLDLAAWAERRGGHRLALVAFAGKAKVLCPLTQDYDHFRSRVRQADPGRLPPDLRPSPDTSPSGTRIGAALALATALHDPRFRGAQDILLVSDGDDPARDAEWVEGVRAARQRGLAVDVVGVGNPEEKSRIPTSDGFLRYAGAFVESRLEEQLLRDIAAQTGGAYVAAQTRVLPLGDLYPEILAQRKQIREDDNTLPAYRQRYPWFLAPALALLALTMLLPEGMMSKKEE